MKRLMVVAFLISGTARAHAGDLTAAEKAAGDEYCTAYIAFEDGAEKMEEQRALERASGVRDLETSRFWAEQMKKQMVEMSDAMEKPEAKWMEKGFKCDGDSKERKVLFKKYINLLGGKI